MPEKLTSIKMICIAGISVDTTSADTSHLVIRNETAVFLFFAAKRLTRNLILNV